MNKSARFSHGTVRESQRRAIFVVRVEDTLLGPMEIDEVTDRMRQKLASRGELTADVVVVQGEGKETLRFYGNPYSVGLVRAAMFNAAISWTPIDFEF
jgi:hypothetical protein